MIKEINNKQEWEGFLAKCCEKTFLQAWNWGEFNKMLGKKIWRFGVYEKDNLLVACLVSKIEAKRGTYLLIEHGPVLSSMAKTQNLKLKIMKDLLIYLKDIAKKEGASFLRICPIWKRTKENEKIFKNLGFRKAPIHEHPEVSWVLGLNKSREELLAGMRKTTRYLIRQALKNSDIEIVKVKDIESLGIFNKIYLETGKRGHFIPFSLEYLKNEFQAFLKDDQILLFLGKYKNKVVAGAIIIFWQDSAFYHQGASLREFAKIPINYLLQWEAIKEAQAKGLKYYSFWGIASEEKANHPWSGLTLFKKGFGGRREECLETQDFIISLKYWPNYLIESARKKKRGF